jgi:sucrose-phosphate synthase
LNIYMVNIHGLLRGKDIEMGRDADTGGQIRYILDFTRELSAFDEINEINIFTRLIKDKRVSDDYEKQIEQVNEKLRIIRLQCGGT